MSQRRILDLTIESCGIQLITVTRAMYVWWDAWLSDWGQYGVAPFTRCASVLNGSVHFHSFKFSPGGRRLLSPHELCCSNSKCLSAGDR